MEQKSLKVSIIMPCRNESELLPRSVESVRIQTYSNWELLIVDDASTDSSYQVACELAKKDSRIRPLRNLGEKGVAGALNFGIQKAKGDYIARWDADDEGYPTRLEKTVAYLDSRPSVGVVGCGVEKRVFASGKLIRTDTFTYDDDDSRLRESLARLVAIGANCLCRREVYEDVGGYDCNLGGEEELDFLIRVAERWGLGFVPEPLYIYNLIEGKGRSFKGRLRKKLIMAKLNVRAIRKFNLSPVNYIYPLMWVIYSMVPLSVKKKVRRKFSI